MTTHTSCSLSFHILCGTAHKIYLPHLDLKNAQKDATRCCAFQMPINILYNTV